MSDSDGLSWKMKQAKLVMFLAMNGDLSADEYDRWRDELKQPNTLWGWISWRVFGI